MLPDICFVIFGNWALTRPIICSNGGPTLTLLPDNYMYSRIRALFAGETCALAAAAVAAAKKLGIPDINIFDGLSSAKVSGRMELFADREKDITVIVD